MPQSDDLALGVRVNEQLGRIDTAQGNFADAEKELNLAEAAIKANRAWGMVAVNILSAQGELQTKLNDTSKARDYFRQAADRLAQMLGEQNAQVVTLRKRANT